MSLSYYIEEEENRREESINNYKYLFSNYENNMPTLNEALNQMFKSVVFDDAKANYLTVDIIAKSKQFIDSRYNTIYQKYQNISRNDAYIICSYTCESIEVNYSPYKILNQNLVSENRRQGIRNISKYLFIFLKSLRKLNKYYPTQTKKYLYRCISRKVSLEKDPFNDKLIPYINGNQKIFWGFTSTSPNPKTTLDFLGKKQQFKTGTIFTLIGNVWGYDITLFNYYNEEEILLEPETKFVVESVLPPVNDIINIICRIQTTSMVLDSNEVKSTPIINDNIINNNQLNNNLLNINNCIVKIEGEVTINNKSNYIRGIGYLCNIPTKYIKVLITYNQILNLQFLNKIKKIIVYINNKELEIDMKIDRYKYTNEQLDITIIEILKEDNINNFLEIDRFIDSKNYINENIETIYLQDGNLLSKITGTVIKKNNNNYICNIKSITNGIIISNFNSKLIGIIKENNNNNLIEFIPMNIIINIINYIKCKNEIKKYDIGKDIRILNNKSSYDENIINKEILNKINVIINGEIMSNILTYKFNKEGLYNIYITSNILITNMSYMFCDCSSLKEINLSSFNTNQVTNMSFMFDGCSSLKEINLTSFNTNQVTDMWRMFYNCSSLQEINSYDKKIMKQFKNDNKCCCIII